MYPKRDGTENESERGRKREYENRSLRLKFRLFAIKKW